MNRTRPNATFCGLGGVLAALATIHSTARAQELDGVAVGDVIRITAPAAYSKRLEGTVLDIGRDSIRIRGIGQSQNLSWQVAIADVSAIRVSAGTRSVTGAGVVGGALIAGGLTYLVLLHATPECAAPNPQTGQTFGCTAPSSSALPAAGVAVLVGGTVGYFVGKQIRIQRWKDVPLQSLQMGIGLSHMGVSVTIAF